MIFSILEVNLTGMLLLAVSLDLKVVSCSAHAVVSRLSFPINSFERLSCLGIDM